MLSARARCTLKVGPAIFSVRPVFSSFDMMLAKTKLDRCVRPSTTAMRLSCSAASMVTKLAPGSSDFATASSFLASRTGTDMTFLFFRRRVPGPNMGCMQTGFIFAGIFERAETVFVFSDEMSMRCVPFFISLAISRMISGVRRVGVQSITYSVLSMEPTSESETFTPFAETGFSGSWPVTSKPRSAKCLQNQRPIRPPAPITVMRFFAIRAPWPASRPPPLVFFRPGMPRA